MSIILRSPNNIYMLYISMILGRKSYAAWTSDMIVIQKIEQMRSRNRISLTTKLTNGFSVTQSVVGGTPPSNPLNANHFISCWFGSRQQVCISFIMDLWMPLTWIEFTHAIYLTWKILLFLLWALYVHHKEFNRGHYLWHKTAVHLFMQNISCNVNR